MFYSKNKSFNKWLSLEAKYQSSGGFISQFFFEKLMNSYCQTVNVKPYLNGHFRGMSKV